MTITEFTELYAQKCGITKGKADLYIEAFKELLEECFDRMEPGERLSFYRFGTFTKKHIAERTVGNIKTGEKTLVPARDKIVFKQSKAGK